MPTAVATAARPVTIPDRRDLFWTAWAMVAAFGSYLCMYGFRKPYTAADFGDTILWGLGFKTVLVTAQVLGYLLSKIVGIRIIAEMTPHRRAATMIGLVILAEAALLLFGLIPRPWNAACLFLNGLPLGLVFGLVLGFLEGRRMTELLTAGLCASFILADGITKSAGSWLLGQGVREDWMPAAAGGVFLIPYGICVAMLARVPPPTHRDVSARHHRGPMTKNERKAFLRRYAVGLIPIVLMFLLVTILRSIRADFAPEIWRGLGSPAAPSIFTRSELVVAIGVLAVNGISVLFTDNRRAFFAALGVCGLGFALLAIALMTRSAGLLDDFGFMVLLGLGLYLPYVAVHTTIFERLIGMTRARGNVGFLMYVADSAGYLGYVAVMLVRNSGPTGGDILGLLIDACWLAIGISTVCLAICWIYFGRLEVAAPPGDVDS